MAFENLKSTGIKYVLTKLKDVFLQIKDAVKSVNNEEPDENGNIVINSVPYAQNLESESSQRNYDAFIQRTAGGDSSVSGGNAWLMVIRGGNTHDDYSPESIDMVVTPVERENPIDATLNRDVFVGYVAESGTITLTYTGSAWSADPTLYGITVNGTPVDGDVITIVYVAEVRGTITVANPQSFVSTGWNLFDSSNGYAKVIKYAFGYRIDGTYTSIKYSATLTGTQSDVVVTDHNFDIPADGYIFVTGGNSTDTAIYPVWEDWSEGTTETFEPYSESVIDLSTIMSTSFPYGLMKAKTALDEIDLNLGQAISRVERLTYTAENLAIAKNSGREFEYDENYIYLVRATPLVVSISVNGSMIVNDHGIEYFINTSVPVYVEILYGNNLKNKLERNVLTISSQNLNDNQKAQVNSNIGSVSLFRDETIEGTKKFTSTSGIYVQGNNKYKYIRFHQNEDSIVGMIRYDAGNATNVTSSQMQFFEYSPKSTADTSTTGKYEQYNLPSATSGNSGNVSYDILTSKYHMRSLGIFTSSSGIEITFAEAGMFIFAIGSINSNRMYLGYAYGHPTNTPVVVDLNKGSNITVTASAGKVTFTSSSSSQAALYVLNMGNASFSWKNL